MRNHYADINSFIVMHVLIRNNYGRDDFRFYFYPELEMVIQLCLLFDRTSILIDRIQFLSDGVRRKL